MMLTEIHSRHTGTYSRNITKTIAPIVVVELETLFQGSMTLEYFHRKVSHLVKQAGYKATFKNRLLQDTIISGISNNKIRIKNVKEGKDVKLEGVIDITRLFPQ